MERPRLLARRPSTGARPGRCAIGVAADTHRPLGFSVSRTVVLSGGYRPPLARVLPQGRIPNLDLPVAGVAAARGEAPAVGAKRQAADKASMAAQSDGLRGVLRLQIPDL